MIGLCSPAHSRSGVPESMPERGSSGKTALGNPTQTQTISRLLYDRLNNYIRLSRQQYAEVHRATPDCAPAKGTGTQRFRGGLVFKAHRLLYRSTLGLRVIKKKKNGRANVPEYMREGECGWRLGTWGLGVPRMSDIQTRFWCLRCRIFKSSFRNEIGKFDSEAWRNAPGSQKRPHVAVQCFKSLKIWGTGDRKTANNYRKLRIGSGQ